MSEAFATTIAHRLRRLRHHAGLTQEQLARMLGNTQQVVAQREKDGHILMHRLPDYCRALRVPILAFYDTGPEGSAVRAKRTVNWELQDYYEALTPEEQETMVRDLRVRATTRQPAGLTLVRAASASISA